ncbi:peptidylprolyl isomerase [Candidatus Latescibacterota bacterium]
MKYFLLFLTILLTFTSCQSTVEKPVVAIITNMGTIEVTLESGRAPITVKNFLTYCNESFYTNTLFHRVIPGFMIQGGGFGTDMKQKKTKAPIQNESGNGLTNKRGSIAMGRTADLNSATSQFYINLVDNFYLDTNKYAVFGEVTRGLEVLDKIGALQTQDIGGAFTNIPVQRAVILSIIIK